MLPQYDSPGKVIVNDGGTLQVRVGTYGYWKATTIKTLLDNATFNPGSKLGIYIQSGANFNFNIDYPIDGRLGISCDRSDTTLTLSAHNTYTGSTTVFGGTVYITGSISENGSDKIFVATWNPAVQGPVPDDEPFATITRRIGAGESYAGYGSTSIGDPSLGVLDWSLKTNADIIDGTNSGGDKFLSMQWSMGATSAAQPPFPGANWSPRVSDILILSGMKDEEGHIDQFTLQMSYLPDALPGGADNEAALAAAGSIVLDVSYRTQFMGVGSIPDGVLGHYGININSHTVWAVVGCNGEFAVYSSANTVPEPGTIAMLVSAMGGLLAIAGRKKGIKDKRGRSSFIAVFSAFRGAAT